jgi:hypothetical protein
MPPGMRPRVSYEGNSQALQYSGYVIFQDSSGALSFHAPVGRDVRKLVTAQRAQGRACQHGFQLPFEPVVAALSSGSVVPTAASVSVAWGEGGYRDAMADARRGLPHNAVLYDVRADLSSFVLLSIYHERCIVLDAAVALPLEAAVPPVASVVADPPPTAAP